MLYHVDMIEAGRYGVWKDDNGFVGEMVWEDTTPEGAVKRAEEIPDSYVMPSETVHFMLFEFA